MTIEAGRDEPAGALFAAVRELGAALDAFDEAAARALGIGRSDLVDRLSTPATSNRSRTRATGGAPVGDDRAPGPRRRHSGGPAQVKPVACGQPTTA